ncbi:hypothetical protein BH20VER2_BH20VER2_07900 [soil metagenome]
MKQSLTSAIAVTMFAAGFAAPALAQDLPKAATFARYQPMMERSPFAVATAAAPAPVAPAFAKELFVANAARLEDESVVTLHSTTDKNAKEYLSTKGPNENGYTIEDIQWSDRVGATQVTIGKDGQTATLSFNQALLTQPLSAGVPAQVMQQQMPQPQQMPNQGAAVSNFQGQQIVAPAPIPTLPTPPPRTRGVIQRNPGVQPAIQQPPVQQQQVQQPQAIETATE